MDVAEKGPVWDNGAMGHAGNGAPGGICGEGFGCIDVRMRVGLESCSIGAEWPGGADGRERSELG